VSIDWSSTQQKNGLLFCVAQLFQKGNAVPSGSLECHCSVHVALLACAVVQINADAFKDQL
jgi:hypothetical protein